MTASVRKESSAAESNAEHWGMISALMGGTSAMRAAGENYLPKWPNEEKEAYNARLKVATLYPAFSRTVDILASKPFSKALTLSEDTPKRIAEWCNDADLQGRNLHAFAAGRLAECIAYGVTGVLVDFPQANGVKTQAQEKAAGVRPFLAVYSPGTVLGWKTERISGAERLTQIRLLERVTEDDGDFGEKTVEQVRVLRRGSWEIWRKSERSEDWLLHEQGARTLLDIPFVFFYGIRTGFGTGKSPLVELAFLNVEHWQSCSDQQTILHVARVPILAVIGADSDTKITVGAKSAVSLPLGADMRFVEHSGAAIASGRESIVDLEERMRQVGAELLVLQPGKITATQVQSENEGNKCDLQRIAETFEDSLDQCLAFMAAWVNESVSGSVSLFKDFGAATLAEASAQLLLQANQAGKISDETLFSEFKRRGIVSSDATWEDEQDRIADQGPPLGAAGVEAGNPSLTQSAPAQLAVSAPPAVDLSPVESRLDAIESAISATRQEPTPQVINITMPEQPAPVVNIAPAAVTVEAPQVTVNPPAITVEAPQVSIAPPAITLEAPTINLPEQKAPVVVVDAATTVQGSKQIQIQRDASGKIVGAQVENQTVQ